MTKRKRIQQIKSGTECSRSAEMVTVREQWGTANCTTFHWDTPHWDTPHWDNGHLAR